ncbi:28S ribosomal protein S11, mitochondrial isoform X2 [Eublepharis macularius]|uniref:28S ribosomal protein S11, mitochondrial isoform X2 n=1 Tax=Eublepharis macularius TaxID=481883 RepID=A0AA97KJC3_EUBMA|nr:28S ribosomal protein S11, mitochondrial isoform X2 [Eublepharis macularius]
MIAALAVARRGLLGGDSGCGIALVRSVQTSLQRLQELAENSASQAAEAPEDQNKRDFSTHIQVVSHQNISLTIVTCGTEGFKNAKKGTAVAAQTAGISAAAKACAKGVSHVRVVVKGLGPGRQAAINGLTMGGLEVISITDNTPIPHNGCRPRKVRRL